MNKKEPTLLKRVVIKEELVAITGDFISALILNQFLYWTERMKNVDAFLEEESNRNKEGENQAIPPTKGFFYKSADELNNELMLGLSGPSMRNYIRKIVEMGYVYERRNPYHKWDKTLQYRVNIIKLQNDLELKGYSLNKYPLSKNLASISNNLASSQDNLAAIPEINNTENINNNKKIYKKVLGSDENINTSKKQNIESFQKTEQLAADRKTLLPYIELFPRDWQRESKFRVAWAEWVQHRKEIKKQLTELSTSKLVNMLFKLGMEKAIHEINQAIESGWTGVHPTETKKQFKQDRPNNGVFYRDRDNTEKFNIKVKEIESEA